MTGRFIAAASLMSLVVALPRVALAQPSAHLAKQQAGPAFVFPANGQTFPYRGPYLFQVQSVRGAMGYLWTFSQNGVIVWQNLDATGSLSSATMSVKGGSPTQRHMHPGALQVRVRAEMKGGSWTNASSVTVQLQGAASPPGALPTKAPSHSSGGRVLYEATVANGKLNDWRGTSDWKHLNGMLVDSGTSFTGWVLAPYQTGDRANYAIEAQIQVVQCSGPGWAIKMRTPPTASDLYADGYHGAVWGCAPNSQAILGAHWSGNEQDLEAQPFDPGTSWHTYRLEARGNSIRFLIAGALIDGATDNRVLSGGGMGIWDQNIQINVRSFKVIAL